MILVTGASGFVGKHLIEALVKEYGKEDIVSLSSFSNNLCRNITHNGYQFSENYFVDAGFESISTIIHAGAFTPKNAKNANDWVACNSNIINTHNLLKCNFPELTRIIYLSTLDVYGKDDIISEKSPVSPISLYAQSKYYCEKMIEYFGNYKKIIFQNLRIGHVYGPGEESYQKIIPNTIKRVLAENTVEIWGTGNEIRSFIYISDIINAIQKSIHLDKAYGPINLVSGEKISITELVNKIIKLSGRKIDINYRELKGESRNLVFDNSKMNEILCSEEMSLDEGLSNELQYMGLKNT